MSLDKMIESVHDIERLAEIIVDMTSQPSPPAPEILAEARWNFARCAMLHLQLKEKLVYGPLEQDADPGIAATIRHFREGQEVLHQQFTNHMQRWTGNAALHDWKGFCVGVREIMNVLFERMASERKTLFPLVQRLGEADSDKLKPARNWNRDIWTIKDAIEKR